MKSRILMCITAITLLAALVVPVRRAAQEQQQPQSEKLQHYTVTDLGTLGGTFSIGTGINNKGWVAGFATLPGDTAQHEFLWVHGLKIDLGTLGGPNSGFFNTAAPNERGAVPGAAETVQPDPLGEDFCFFGTNLICLPSVWQNGVMIPLSTLGGSNGAAGFINSRGQVVGDAENTALDPTCPSPRLQYKPVLWENGEIQELPTVSGDPDGFGAAINDLGQAVGMSGICLYESVHALLWQNGAVTDLGNLGGTISNQSTGINNLGQVVGVSGLPGNTAFHAFLWQNGAMTDLGTLPGLAFYSQAGDINDSGQAAGLSCDVDFNCDAFLWQNGTMTDLNSLIPAGSPLFLVAASRINSRGAISGEGFEPSTGEIHAFLATPSNGEGGSESATPATPDSTSERPKVVLPENVRKLLQQRLHFGRFGAGFIRLQ